MTWMNIFSASEYRSSVLLKQAYVSLKAIRTVNCILFNIDGWNIKGVEPPQAAKQASMWLGITAFLVCFSLIFEWELILSRKQVQISEQIVFVHNRFEFPIHSSKMHMFWHVWKWVSAIVYNFHNNHLHMACWSKRMGWFSVKMSYSSHLLNILSAFEASHANWHIEWSKPVRHTCIPINVYDMKCLWWLLIW